MPENGVSVELSLRASSHLPLPDVEGHLNVSSCQSRRPRGVCGWQAWVTSPGMWRVLWTWLAFPSPSVRWGLVVPRPSQVNVR